MRATTRTEFDDGAVIETFYEERLVQLPDGRHHIRVVGGSSGKAPVGSELGRLLFGDPDPRPKA